MDGWIFGFSNFEIFIHFLPFECDWPFGNGSEIIVDNRGGSPNVVQCCKKILMTLGSAVCRKETNILNLM